MHKPALLLADEPTGNLDPTTAARVMDVLVTEARAHGASLVLVTHSEAAAAPAFWNAVGVDLKVLPYVKVITVEEIFTKIEEIIEEVIAWTLLLAFVSVLYYIFTQ